MARSSTRAISCGECPQHKRQACRWPAGRSAIHTRVKHVFSGAAPLRARQSSAPVVPIIKWVFLFGVVMADMSEIAQGTWIVTGGCGFIGSEFIRQVLGGS